MKADLLFPKPEAQDLAPLFWPPSRLGVDSAWYGHVPFAHWLVSSVKPRLVVELGTHNGVSYAAFCEAVVRGHLPTACFAVDTWKGDEHSGLYGEDVYEDLVRFNSARYGWFSELLRCTFDEAVPYFADNSIDLLHIDGLHTYQTVKHDFESWRPKLSERGVVLLHDTNVRERGFGVWHLFLDIKQRWPTFEFLHGHGLGVAAVGADVPPALAALCALSGGSINSTRERFSLIGERWSNEYRELALTQHKLHEHLQAIESLGSELRGTHAVLASERGRAQGLESALRKERDRAQVLEAVLRKERDRAQGLEAAFQEERDRTQILESALKEGRGRAQGLESVLQQERDRAQGLESALQQERDRARGLESVLQQERGRADALAAEIDSLRGELHRTVSFRMRGFLRKTFSWSRYDGAYQLWKRHKNKKEPFDRHEALEMIRHRYGVHSIFVLYIIYKPVKPFVRAKRSLMRVMGREGEGNPAKQPICPESVPNCDVNGPEEVLPVSRPNPDCVQNGDPHGPEEPLLDRRPNVIRRYANNGNGVLAEKARILVIGAYIASQRNNIDDIVQIIFRSEHYNVTQRWIAIDSPSCESTAHVTVRGNVPMTPKCVLLNSLLENTALDRFEYILTVDDDIILPEGFIDEFLYLQTRLEFAVAQPARTNNSFIDLPIVGQHPGVAARQTRFVESGPVVSFHRCAFPVVFPFDVLSPMGWGLEQVWSFQLGKRRLKMGIIDNTPVDHSMRPPVTNYEWAEANSQRTVLLKQRDHLSLDDCFCVLRVYNFEDISQ